MTSPEGAINKILTENIGKTIDITIVHHVEGQHLRTTGKLTSFNENIIVLAIEYKDHWYARKKKGQYVCNRKATSLLSIFILGE